MNGTDEIRIVDVEHELTRLWRESATAGGEAEGREGVSALVRATTLNLVVAGCGREDEGLSQVLSEVTRRHPSRVIVIRTDGEPGEPRAWVSMVCHARGRGQSQVCSEHVVLSGPPSSLHALVGSVAGMLVSDLPTFVWWRGRLPESDVEHERFSHLSRLARRLIFDSADYSKEQLKRVAQLSETESGLALGDLNWARLTSWRSAVAQVFDPPAARDQLPQLRSARLVHRSQTPSASVRLMAGWLRSRVDGRLELEFAPGAADLLELRAPERTIEIPRPAELSESEALSEELRMLGRDRGFEQALHQAVLLL